jgi:cellulose synthase (UDP-forming)
VNWPARLYDPHHAGVVAINLVWVFFNIVILGVATAVARESHQRRETVRLSVALPSDVILPDGSMLQGVTSDLSNGGVRTSVAGKGQIKPGDPIKFVFPLLDGTATISAKVVGQDGDELRASF